MYISSSHEYHYLIQIYLNNMNLCLIWVWLLEYWNMNTFNYWLDFYQSSDIFILVFIFAFLILVLSSQIYYAVFSSIDFECKSCEIDLHYYILNCLTETFTKSDLSQSLLVINTNDGSVIYLAVNPFFHASNIFSGQSISSTVL